MSQQSLAGLRLLVLEDEFLIAMDVEQICRDNGAADVVICRTIEQAEALEGGFDAAVLDMMLGTESTVPFALDLQARGVPFIFASGYANRRDIKDQFPGTAVVGKPYAGDDLVGTLAAAVAARRGT